MIKKILKGLLFSIIALFVLIAVVRLIGRGINSITPKGGINENFYVDINGSKQWISIYGKDRNNPVLLYLHGGPRGQYAPSIQDCKGSRNRFNMVWRKRR